MTTEIVSRNVVILPPEDIDARIIQEAQRISTEFGVPTNFVLDGQAYKSHATIHQFPVLSTYVGHLEEGMSNLAKRVQPFEVTLLSRISLFANSGIFWDIDPENQGFKYLHS